MWSFGVLVFEAVTRGATPYPDMPTLMEVAEYVKAGGTMGCPRGCPPQVFVQVMAPCWAADPASRPGFAELRSVLGGLGAVDAGDEAERLATIGRKNSSSSRRKRAPIPMPAGDLALIGPSVHHIVSTLLRKAVAAVQPPWVDKHGNAVSPPESVTIAQTVEAVAAPAGAKQKCPRDGGVGAAYVDTLSGINSVGPSTALLSYTWAYMLASVAGALAQWVEKSNRDPKRTYIWICSLCLNQHRMVKTLSPEELSQEFGARVQAIGHILPMLEP